MKLYLFFVLLLSLPLKLNAALKMLYVSPSDPTFSFHNDVDRFMRAVASDLDIKLDVISTMGAGHYIARQRIESYIKNNGKPNYIIGTIQRRVAHQVMKLSSEQEINYYTVNTDVLEGEKKRIGKPRGKFKFWLGQMVPSDESAGRLLANSLLSLAKIEGDYQSADGIYHMVGISGGRDTSVAFERNEGLMNAIEKESNIILHQIIFSDWSDDYSFDITPRLYKRYPKVKIIWTASDELASGVHKAIPDKNVLIGGMDWSPEGLLAIQEGRLSSSVGGHFMEAGRALILLHDHFYGLDFIDELGLRINTDMHVIDKNNVDSYFNIINKGWSHIDFKRFSKVKNPSLKKYDFSLETLLKEN